ncbi:uncharacterized protein LOC143366404 [Andrena cerasifolii]|uniref:uncharacterized protein LOC143366404 n=1 Tax=Andrena cerasifolii TaxID=2819439 RepID=UPI0040384203
MKYLILLVLAAACFESCIAKCVETHEGKVSGVKMTSRKGREFVAFKGVPYAEPPVGELRFKSPTPKRPWGHSLEADKDGNECLQNHGGHVKGSEDCLYLNVYTPDTKPKELMPVLVYLHTGAFLVSNASEVLTGPGFMLDMDVVLVTLNYRLGSLGFLSTGDSAANGNYGLKDQRRALEWVQQNIHAFGGDPKEVTLFGHGAGADCAHLHTLSEKSKHLFKQVITQSGNGLCPHAFTDDKSYYDKAKSLGAHLNCPTDDSHKMIDCLRKVDARKLVEQSSSVFSEVERAASIEWRPSQDSKGDDSILPDSPATVIRERKMKNCPMITGNVKDEGTRFAIKMKEDENFYNLCVEKPVDVIKELLQNYLPLKEENVTALAIKVKNFYLGEKLPEDKDLVIYDYMLFMTDFMYMYPEWQLLEYVQQPDNKMKPVYNYNFDYRGALSEALRIGGKYGKEDAAHGDELFYIFPLTSKVIGPQYNIQRTEKDYIIVNFIIESWATFSATGKPYSSETSKDDKWEPCTSKKYLQIGDGSNTSVKSKDLSRSERIQFWYQNTPQYDLGCSSTILPASLRPSTSIYSILSVPQQLQDNLLGHGSYHLVCINCSNVAMSDNLRYIFQEYKIARQLLKPVVPSVASPAMVAVFLFALLATDISCILADPVLQTDVGSVRGIVLESRNGREIFAYLGIPYAEPPTGSFRFRNPVPKRPWGGILDAQTEGEECTQLSGDNVTGSEDCLFLNTYTPTRKRNALLPVMVFIHGGAFQNGNGNRTDYGPNYLLDKDIVLVTCNYRLGIFGFLSTGTMAASGNFGLKDQVLVLKWVKRNIRAFGGNPNDVTLFGQSAGSVCTHLHALSELSKHLFNRYILQSGLATYEWGFHSNSSYYEKAKKVGEMYNCTTYNSYSLVACLRKLPASQLARTESVFTVIEQFLQSLWGPTIEPYSKTAFITDSPINLLQQNKLKNSSFITGNCRDDGFVGSEVLYTNQILYNIAASSTEFILTQYLEYTGLFKGRNVTELAIEIKNFYWGTEMPNDKDKVIRGYTNLVTDLIFFYPSVQYVHGLAERSKQPFYTYLFNYRGSLSRTSQATRNNKDVGIMHGDDLIYLFPETAASLQLPFNVQQSTSDRKISNVMVDLWTTFAIKGVPRSNDLGELSLWQPFAKNKTYLEIGNITEPVTTVQTSFFKRRMTFVYQLYNGS